VGCAFCACVRPPFQTYPSPLAPAGHSHNGEPSSIIITLGTRPDVSFVRTAHRLPKNLYLYSFTNHYLFAGDYSNMPATYSPLVRLRPPLVFAARSLRPMLRTRPRASAGGGVFTDCAPFTPRVVIASYVPRGYPLP